MNELSNNKKKFSNIFYNAAAIGGLYMSLTIVLLMAITSLIIGPNSSIILSVIVSIATVGVFFGKKYRNEVEHHNMIFSYGKAIWLLILMLIFASVIIGSLIYIICNIIAPNEFIELFATFKTTMIEQNVADESTIKQQIDTIYESMGNPITVIASTVFTIVFYGSFPSLFVGSFIKTKK